MESLRADYTEVWCARQNVPLARFADCVRSIADVGLDRLGFLPAEAVFKRLRGFDSIVSWYGSGNQDFRAAVSDLPFQFYSALPDGSCHASEFYWRQVSTSETGGSACPLPTIEAPPAPREFAIIHPFASNLLKRAPLNVFEACARRLEPHMPVHWLCGPEEELPRAVRIDDLYELACWLRGARIFVGNDSGISHLAAAVGTPVLAYFRTTDARVWAPRGPAVHVSHLSIPDVGLDRV